MARRRPLTGVQQAGAKIALTLEALANTGRPVRVEKDGVVSEGTVVDHTVEGGKTSFLVRYRVKIRRVGLVWWSADNVRFS